MKASSAWKVGITGTVVVAALGYFVDVYDLLIFSILRVPSLKSLHVADADLLSTGVYLLNMQMGGMLLGGILWGVLGDKKGRLSVLFGSIFLYSIANILNGLATTVGAYAFCRFFAGLGLAGELGAGITLVTELMSKENRGYGTTLVATVGVAGAIFAAIVGEHLDWVHAYYVGGGLGLCLLFLRLAVSESGMFGALIEKKHIARGDLLQLISSRERLWRYLRCIFVGMPIWYVIGVLITFSPEFGKAFGITEPISAGKSVLYAYIGLVGGDLGFGLVSQWLRSRKKVLYASLVITALCVVGYLTLKIDSAQTLYYICLPVGFSVGYWSVFVTNAAEQFGTNLRATVTTTAPNFVRGATVVITSCFEILKPHTGIITSAFIVGAATILVAWISLSGLQESFGKDLDYTE